MKLTNLNIKFIFLPGIFLLGLTACHTQKVVITRHNEANSSTLDPVHTQVINKYSENPVISKPRLGFNQYLNYVNAYIQDYSPIAIQEMKQYGVPASIILAQGIHESGAGKSNLATQANNHFGVKCTSDWTGGGFYMDDDKPNECFRKYASPIESFQDHMAFLQRKRYSSLFSLGSQDYKAWAYGLKTCGYATNPNYPQILISLIQKYNLNRFDEGGSNAPLVDNPAPVSKPKLNSTNPVILRDTIHQKVYKTDTVYSIAYVNGAPNQGLAMNMNKNLPKINQASIQKDSLKSYPVQNYSSVNTVKAQGQDESEFYTVRQGDTLYSIARRFNLSMDQIKTMNQLNDSGIKIDQVLRVKP